MREIVSGTCPLVCTANFNLEGQVPASIKTSLHFWDLVAVSYFFFWQKLVVHMRGLVPGVFRRN